MQFTKATKKTAKARVAIVGPAGSGKTWTALELALELGPRVAVVDSEHGSASKYSDRFAFDTVELTNFAPAHYIEAIQVAERAGYDCVVIDSLSHPWMGTGGLLEQADNRGGGFDVWKTLTPQQNKLIEAISAAKIHVIATMRSKTEYVVEKGKNKAGNEVNKPRKVGLAPVQRDGMEYEFDVVLLADENNVLTVTKTRCPALSEQAWRHQNKDMAALLKAWLSDGVVPAEEPKAAGQTADSAPKADPEKAKPAAKTADKPLPVAALSARLAELNIKGKDAVLKWLSDNIGRKVARWSDLKPAELEKLQKLADETPLPQEKK